MSSRYNRTGPTMDEQFDFLVIGSGIAGLSFALEAAQYGTVAVLTKAEVAESNTTYAQGGIAAAVGEADSWQLHEEDTLVAGAGLCDVEAVRFLVQAAPEAISWLEQIGARFDRDPGDANPLRLGREGGHSRNRIIHFEDRTGWEIERAVTEAVRRHPDARVFEHAFVTNLRLADGRCVGADAVLADLGPRVFRAPATLLATGGCGMMYLHSTNPRVATGDGIALALAAGAAIRHMEFMQFHPTTFYHPQMRGFLISEAVRGAGATLRNHLGVRFMYDYDDRLELAPRDIVARAIDAEIKRLATWCVYLDATHLSRELLDERFPTISARLREAGIEMYREWIPVVPAQHYSCGGVTTDRQGRTTVPGLYAAGEVASTGVHGANRLASNSLLEAMVFAREAARSGAGEPPVAQVGTPTHQSHAIAESEAVRIRRHLQKTMTDHAGIVRTDDGLAEAEATIAGLIEDYDALPVAPWSSYALETRNLLLAACEVVRGARSRTDNVGLHYNEDRALGRPARPSKARG